MGGVRNSGSRAYVIARFAVLGKIDSPRIKDNIQRADATVPLHARIFGTPCIRERVVSCERVSRGSGAVEMSSTSRILADMLEEMYETRGVGAGALSHIFKEEPLTWTLGCMTISI